MVVGASPERRGGLRARQRWHPFRHALKRPQTLLQVFVPDMALSEGSTRSWITLFADGWSCFVDEAYLDVSRCQSEITTLPEAALAQARAIKQRVLEECQLTISVGIAGNKLMAKIASDYDKPDGLILIPEADKVAFLAALPIRRLPGIGQVTEQALRQAGIQRIAQLQRLATQIKGVSSNHLKQIQELAMGVDHRRVEQNEVIKSMSSETTFDEDTQDRQRIANASGNRLGERLAS